MAAVEEDWGHVPQNKNSKMLVRERIAKTGEANTTARYRFEPPVPATPGTGVDPEAEALARALAAAGFVNPITGRPFSEDVLFGAGGGIGFSYFVFQYSGWTSFSVSGGFNAAYFEKKENIEVACSRLGLPLRVRQTASAAAAEKQLREALASRREVPLTMDLAQLPGQDLALGLPWCPQTVTVCGDGGGLAVTGPRGRRFTVGWEEMARARAAYNPAKHRLYVLGTPAAVDPGPGLLAAIGRTANCLLEPTRVKTFDGNFGVPGMRKWARLLADPRDSKGWTKLYVEPDSLRQALATVVAGLGGPGSGGGACRPLYARFLDQAAGLLRAPRLAEAAVSYRDLGERWAGLIEFIRSGTPTLPHLAKSVLDLASAEESAALGLKAAVSDS